MNDSAPEGDLIGRLKNMSKEERNARVMRGLERFLSDSDAVKKLSDRELCAQVIEKVWGKFVLGSKEDWLVDELVERFEKRSGIERDEEGRVIPE